MLSENIRTIRKNKGYSQEELAYKLHVTRQTISKWETGRSVPDADLLKNMADIFEISVSEIMDGDAERILEKEVIVEQLSRINEHLTIAQKKSERKTKMALCLCAAILVVVGAILGIKAFHDRKALGEKVRGTEHIGALAYNLPENGYYCSDLFLETLPDGTERIVGKEYKNYNDLSVITIAETDDKANDQEFIEEFKETYEEDVKDLLTEHGALPDSIETYIAASDGGNEESEGIYCCGSYYIAYFLADEKVYKIEVLGGDDPLCSGELVVTSMYTDEELCVSPAK